MRLATSLREVPGGHVVNGEPNEAVTVARRWSVRFPNRHPLEVIFCPEVSHAQVVSIYPGAAIESLAEPPPRKATVAETDELRKLVALVLRDADDTDREEALAVALADPAAALTSFRALAVDLETAANQKEG